MSLPPINLSSDSIEDLNLDAVATPTTDSVDRSDYPPSDALDRATSPLSATFRRSTSPSSEAAEPSARKEWPLLSFEQHVQHYLKSRDAADIVGNEDKIGKMYQDYQKDYELVKPILDTLIRFTVDNHEIVHEMAHGMLNNLSLGHTLLIPNPFWVKREEQIIAAAATEIEKERKKVEVEARAEGPTDLLTKVQAFTTKAKANAKSTTKGNSDTDSTSTADSADKLHNKTKPTDKKGKTKGGNVTNDKAAAKPADPDVDSKVKGTKKFVPYIPKYLLDVHSRKYCMNDALVTRGSIGDLSIVSCLAASARKAHARIVANKSRAKRSDAVFPLPERCGEKRLRDGLLLREGKEGDARAVAVTAEAVVGDLKAIEGSYPDGVDGLISEVVKGMLWM